MASPEALQQEIERFIRAKSDGLSPEEAALVVAQIVSRAAAELHRLARAEAVRLKGTAEWGQWASLQNAARAAVLQAASCRDVASRLSRRGQ